MLIEYFDKQRLCIFTLKDIYVGECTFIKRKRQFRTLQKNFIVFKQQNTFKH